MKCHHDFYVKIFVFVFQVLFEKDGVYIQVNVNSNTTDKDAHIPGKVYLMKKVYNQISKFIHTPL